MNDRESTYDYKEDRIEIIDKARNHFWYIHRNKIIERLLHGFNKRSLNILELGAGSRNIASYLHSKGYKVAASDYFQTGIDIIKSHSILAFQYDLLTNSPHYDEHMGAYDIVILGDVIEHLNDPVQALNNARSFLKKKGMILITVPALKLLWTRYDNFAGHKRRYSVKLLSDHMEAGGYLPVKVRYFMLLPGIMLSITRKLKNYLTRKRQKKFSAELNINSILNNVMKALMSIEYIIQTFIYIPFGSSIYGLGVVRDED